MNFVFNEKVFGKNDIRGIVGEGICKELFALVGRAYSEFIKERSNKTSLTIAVAMDARTHSPELKEAIVNGVLSSGINVIDIGLCPTPLAYFSEFSDLAVDGSLIITASHNPSPYNGLKMTFNKASLSESEIAEVKEITKKYTSNLPQDAQNKGEYKEYDLIKEYIKTFAAQFAGAGKGIKVVVDSGNATGGVVAPQLYREIGCEVIDIFSEPDGNFPNHHPNPSEEKNILALKAKVIETGADLGIAFDGDSDRVGVVDNKGYALPGDQLLLIFALDILKSMQQQEDKPVFISEVKCSQILYDMIDKSGGKSIMWKTGHAYIKSKMKEEKAILAGEMSGHIFFKDKFYGYDDGVYGGLRAIEVLSKNKTQNAAFKFSDLIDSLPKAFTSQEVRKPCPDELKQIIINNLQKEIDENPAVFNDKIEKIITIDGLRIVFDGGFALIRASNTEPTFTLRFEGKTQDKTESYEKIMLSLIDKNLEKLRK